MYAFISFNVFWEILGAKPCRITWKSFQQVISRPAMCKICFKKSNPHARHPPRSIGILQKSIVKHAPPLPTCPPTPTPTRPCPPQHVGRGQALHFERKISNATFPPAIQKHTNLYEHLLHDFNKQFWSFRVLLLLFSWLCPMIFLCAWGPRKLYLNTSRRILPKQSKFYWKHWVDQCRHICCQKLVFEWHVLPSRWHASFLSLTYFSIQLSFNWIFWRHRLLLFHANDFL